MNSKKEVQHVYLVGAKSLGAYGGYETFVYKLTEYHQNKENIKYHVACKANGDGCMDESKFDGVTKINDHEFEFHNAHCFKIDVPQIGPAQAIYYDVAALKACCEHIKKNHIPHADRCLCVDEKGNVITGDHILYIYGCYMKERGKLLNNTVVTTVMSNFGLYKAFDEQGIGYAKTAVGDKYVYEYMAKNGCRIGGEQSGHIIFSKYASTGDGILTSLKMMEVMLAKKKSMSELAAPLKIYPQVLENVRVTDKKAAQNDSAVQEAVNKVTETLGDTGRILVRESGTEPVVRVMVEAPDHDTCQKYVSEVVDVIRDRGYSL